MTPFFVRFGGVPLAARLHTGPGRRARGRPDRLLADGQGADARPVRFRARRPWLGAAVIVDFAGFGASGGEPRQLESPAREIADLPAVLAHVGTLSQVRPGPPAVLAVCASAQYAVATAARACRWPGWSAWPAGSTTWRP